MTAQIKAEDHIALAFTVAKKYVGSADIIDSEEYADALVGLIKAVSAFDPEKKTEFSTLAVTCMQNEIRNGLRRRKRQFIPSASVAGTDETEEPINEPIDKRSSEDKITAIGSFLSLILSPGQNDSPNEKQNKQLVRSHFIDGISMKELGDQLNISREAIRQRVARTLQKLKDEHENLYWNESIFQMN